MFVRARYLATKLPDSDTKNEIFSKVEAAIEKIARIDPFDIIPNSLIDNILIHLQNNEWHYMQLVSRRWYNYSHTSASLITLAGCDSKKEMIKKPIKRAAALKYTRIKRISVGGFISPQKGEEFIDLLAAELRRNRIEEVDSLTLNLIPS